MANIDYTVVQGIAGLIADFKLKDTRFVLANMQVSQQDVQQNISRSTVKYTVLSVVKQRLIMFLNLLLIAPQNIIIWPFYFTQPGLVCNCDRKWNILDMADAVSKNRHVY